MEEIQKAVIIAAQANSLQLPENMYVFYGDPPLTNEAFVVGMTGQSPDPNIDQSCGVVYQGTYVIGIAYDIEDTFNGIVDQEGEILIDQIELYNKKVDEIKTTIEKALPLIPPSLSKTTDPAFAWNLDGEGQYLIVSATFQTGV